MRRYNTALVRDAELQKRFVRVPHRVPIGRAAHDNADQRFFSGDFCVGFVIHASHFNANVELRNRERFCNFANPKR